MKHLNKDTWSGGVRPLIERERRAQVAALCYRDGPQGKQILLITSRDTGRWIIPKGWPITGLDGPASALQEAWEEAGVRNAEISEAAIGTYPYDKGLKDGETVAVDTAVYAARVTDLARTYPEVDERTRKWVTPDEAAHMVDEPDLKAILRAF